MRKPTVENKYNLKPSDVPKLKVVNRERICEPIFWRNDVVKAWCICGRSSKSIYYRGENTFWLSIYDEDAKAYAGKIRYLFTSHEGMCSYKFTKFFDYRQIENEADLQIQELFLEKINYLLDEGILTI